MPLKRFNKEPSAVDIRGLSLPAREAKAPEFIYDPEAELTEDQWESIIACLKQVEHPESIHEADNFVQGCSLISLVYPQHFLSLPREFKANVKKATAILKKPRGRERDNNISGAQYLLVRKLFDKNFIVPEFSPENLRKLQAESGKMLSLMDALFLLVIYPDKVPEIKQMLLDDELFFRMWSMRKDFWNNLNYLALKKILFPDAYAKNEALPGELVTSEKITPDYCQQVMDRILNALNNNPTPFTLNKDILKIALALKILTMKEVAVTEQGFVESARIEPDINEELPPQPAALDIYQQ